METKINFYKYLDTVVTIEKLEDVKFEGNHPNGYNVGFKQSNARVNIEASYKYGALFINYYPDNWFHTSHVLRIEEYEGYDLVYTLNSVYKITPQFNSIPGTEKKYSLSNEENIEDTNEN